MAGVPVGVRFAYADPPYIGMAKRHYGDHPDYAGEVDHAALIRQLEDYDGWALSCSTPSLRLLLPICPDEVRVMAWVKPWAVFKPNVNPAYAWEPVLVKVGPRQRTREEATVRDWISCGITLQRGVVGAKPEPFCWWLFEVLGMTREDEFDDLFPGTGGVMDAFGRWKQQMVYA